MEKASKIKVAYFSLEIALEKKLQSYAGGLGILAGDLLRSAADLNLPMVGVTLLNDQGYFKQGISQQGQQQVEPVANYDFTKIIKLPETVSVSIGTDKIQVNAWQYLMTSQIANQKQPFTVPIILLDTNCSANAIQYRHLTRRLYDGGELERLKQEIILGRGGVKMLQALGYNNLQKFHLNEGHGALVAIELFLNSQVSTDQAITAVRDKCVFTTHTPVKEAINVYPAATILQYQPDFPQQLPGLVIDEQINMTTIGLYFSGYSNAVSKKHQAVAQQMFPEYKIQAVTNGVHSATWTAPEFQVLYDKYLGDWRLNSQLFSQVEAIPLDELAQAHQEAKARLLKHVYQQQGIKLESKNLTIGLARRFTVYKRMDLLFYDMQRLLAMAAHGGPLQIVCAGKAHPRDWQGQEIIAKLQKIKKIYQSKLKLVFLEDYNLEQAQLIMAGVDVLLNTPLPPWEASGTSGMKAAHNGVPHLSTLDGWWPEGYLVNQTGWAIGQGLGRGADLEVDFHDATSLYELLEQEVLPLYYQEPKKWLLLSRNTIKNNAAIFTAVRALRQYWQEAYHF